jgi:electron transfer flavoprotein beta subunit
MKSVVFVKQVPDTTADIRVDNGEVTYIDAPLVINPWDEIAVEAALQQKEEHGGVVVAVSLGEDDATVALKHALSMGCDEAVLISDPSLARSDNLVISQVLAAVVRKLEDVKMAFFGRQAIDTDAGVTAAQVARGLGWPILSLVSSIEKSEPNGGLMQVLRSTEEGQQLVEAELPAVLTVGRDLAEPRYPSFIRKRKAAKAIIPIWGLDDLGLEALSPVVEWFGAEAVPPQEIEVEIIDVGTPQETAEKLVENILKEIEL